MQSKALPQGKSWKALMPLAQQRSSTCEEYSNTVSLFKRTYLFYDDFYLYPNKLK